MSLDSLNILLSIIRNYTQTHQVSTLLLIFLAISNTIATIAIYYLRQRLRVCRDEVKLWREKAQQHEKEIKQCKEQCEERIKQYKEEVERYEKEKDKLIEFLARYGIAPIYRIEDVKRVLMQDELLGKFLRVLDRDGIVSLEELEKLVFEGLKKD